MSGRLSGSSARTPITDRIKLFGGAAPVAPRKTPPVIPKNATPNPVPFSPQNLRATPKMARASHSTNRDAPNVALNKTKDSPTNKDSISPGTKATRTDSNSSSRSDLSRTPSTKSQSGKANPTEQKNIVSRQLASAGSKAASSPRVVKKSPSPNTSISSNSSSQSSKSSKSPVQKTNSRTRVSLSKDKDNKSDILKKTSTSEIHDIVKKTSTSEVHDIVKKTSTTEVLDIVKKTSIFEVHNIVKKTSTAEVLDIVKKTSISEGLDVVKNTSTSEELDVVKNTSTNELLKKSSISDNTGKNSEETAEEEVKEIEDRHEDEPSDIPDLIPKNLGRRSVVSFAGIPDDETNENETNIDQDEETSIISHPETSSITEKIEMLSRSSSKSSINDNSINSSIQDLPIDNSSHSSLQDLNKVSSPYSSMKDISKDLEDLEDTDVVIEEKLSPHREKEVTITATPNPVNDDLPPIVAVHIEDKVCDKVMTSDSGEGKQFEYFKNTDSVVSMKKSSFYNEKTVSEMNLNNKEECIKTLYSNKEEKLLNDLNLNNKLDKLDNESVINNNFGSHTDNQYFTNQALKNVNSATISQAMKLDIEYKDDKISNLTKQLEEMENSSVTEDEVRGLKKQKHDLDSRLRDQEEELDDLASQVQLLEAGKSKLEMTFQQIKKEHRKELEAKEDEIEDVRASAQKKVKVLEQQLEQEHEERIGFLREKHDLEGKILNLQDMLERSGDEEQVAKLKKDLKKTKALLKDAQTVMDKTQTDGTSKVILRQLKNQLEDAEFARQAAMKGRQNTELELADVQGQLDEVSRAKSDLDDRNLRMSREKADIGSQLQEADEELQDVMKKYKASVAAVATDQITIQDQAANIQELEAERNKLREQLAEINQRLDHMEGENVSTAQHKRLELKVRELESKLELEKTTKNRLESQIQRGKEIGEKFQKEVDELKMKESSTLDELKKHTRAMRDVKEDLSNIQSKEQEASHKKSELEKQLQLAETETETVKNELKLANKRIEDLQAAISGEIDSDNDSDQDCDSSDEEMATFLDHHRRAMSVQRDRQSVARDSMIRELSVSRDMRSREFSAEPRDTRDIRSMSRDIRASVAREMEVATRDLPTFREIPEGIAEED